VEHPTTPVYLPIPRPKGTGDGCPEIQLGDHRSAIHILSNLPTEDSGVQQQVSSDPALLEPQILVSTAVEPGHRRPNSHSSKGKSPVSGALQKEQEVAPLPRDHELSRLALIRKYLSKRGFPEEVAEKAAEPQRNSTLRAYEHIWKKYVSWLVSRGSTDPLKTTVQLLILYLMELKKENKAVGTILVHKAYIVKTLERLTDGKLQESGTLADLVKN
jgi:hypothetical protein